MDQYTHDLLSAAKEGNIDAFEHIYHMFKDKVYAVSLSTLKNPQDAEDATQQTFMRVYEKLGTLNDLNAFNTWIQRIAINESNMILRKRKGDVSIDDETNGALVEKIEDEFMLPQEYAERDDLSIRLREIIDDLPAVQRQALVLQMYSNMSTAEIAQVMGCSENTVKSRLRYAKAHIKTEIEERERKSGDKFYGAVFLPFGSVYTRLVQSESMSPAVTERIWGELNSYIAHIANGAAGGAVGKTAASTAAKAGLSTGAKIAIGAIAGTLIIGGAIFGTLYGMAQSKNVATPDSASSAVVTEPTSVQLTEAPTEVPTEPDYSLIYSDYVQVLNSFETNIRDYEAMPNKSIDHGIEVRSVAFADVMGDPAPEMIYIARNYYSDVSSGLYIVSYADGHAYFAYSDENFATLVSRGPGYYLFTNGDALYACSANGGENTESYSYFRFDPEVDGLIEKKDIFYGSYADSDSSAKSSARIGGEEAPLSAFEAEREKLLESAEHLLMVYDYNVQIDPEAQKRFSDMKNEAMNYDEAIAYLKGHITSPSSSAADSSDEMKAALSSISGVYVSMSLPTGRGGHEITSDGTHIFTMAMPTNNGVSETSTEDTVTEVVKVSDTAYRFTCVDDSGNSYTHSVYYPGTSLSETSVKIPDEVLESDERSSGVLSRRILITEGGLLYVWMD